MSEASQNDRTINMRRTILVLLPLAIFLGLAILFYVGLQGNPTILPSVLIGKPMPKTELPPLEGLLRDGKPVPGINEATFKDKVTLVNVWASWCVPCRDEAPFLEQLSRDKRFQIVGINYKDAPDDARRFLARFGNPYVAVGVDRNGAKSIDWGVYGVPETYVIDRKGIIAYKLVGPILAGNLQSALMPAIEKTLAEK